MATADPLLDALRIPGKIVIDDQIAELQVDALGGRFRGDHDGCFVPEVLDECGPHIGAGGAGYAVGSLVLCKPALVNRLGAWVGVRAVEHHDLAGKLGFLKNPKEILLRAARFGEDLRFFC